MVGGEVVNADFEWRLELHQHRYAWRLYPAKYPKLPAVSAIVSLDEEWALVPDHPEKRAWASLYAYAEAARRGPYATVELKDSASYRREEEERLGLGECLVRNDDEVKL